MSSARYLVGDVFERMAELEDGSVDLVLTSPPFLALRSYLPADHPDKAKEIGSEPTPAAFLDTLLALTAEWRRLLAPHGSIAVELGDTYSGSGGAGGDYAEGGMREGQPMFKANTTRYTYGDKDGGRQPGDEKSTTQIRNGGGPGWPLAKSLCGIPHLYHLSLAYGRNLLTGKPSPAGLWRVRNVVAWCRPNPPVGALGDKFRPATSYMTVACVSGSRYFDLDAVRTEPKPHTLRYPRNETPAVSDGRSGHDNGARTNPGQTHQYNAGNEAGAPPLDWWEIPTAPYAGSHYATWPPALCKRPIESMVPQRVCVTCGKPSERIVSNLLNPDAETDASYLAARAAARHGERLGMGSTGRQHTEPRRVVPTGEWTDCGHDTWRNGLVLDPFGGSGTTAAVATGCGRDAVLIDLDERNADLARERVGMFLTVETDPDPRPVEPVDPSEAVA